MGIFVAEIANPDFTFRINRNTSWGVSYVNTCFEVAISIESADFSTRSVGSPDVVIAGTCDPSDKSPIGHRYCPLNSVGHRIDLAYLIAGDYNVAAVIQSNSVSGMIHRYSTYARR